MNTGGEWQLSALAAALAIYACAALIAAAVPRRALSFVYPAALSRRFWLVLRVFPHFLLRSPCKRTCPLACLR